MHHSNIRSWSDGSIAADDDGIIRRVEVRAVQPGDHDEAARIITDALLDDPGWRAVGPDSRKRRRRVLLGSHRAVVEDQPRPPLLV